MLNELASQCRFYDCMHNTEPNCAIQQAIAEGVLSYERLESYQKSKYDGLNAKQIEEMKINEMFGGNNNMKNLMRNVKNRHNK